MKSILHHGEVTGTGVVKVNTQNKPPAAWKATKTIRKANLTGILIGEEGIVDGWWRKQSVSKMYALFT